MANLYRINVNGMNCGDVSATNAGVAIKRVLDSMGQTKTHYYGTQRAALRLGHGESVTVRAERVN